MWFCSPRFQGKWWKFTKQNMGSLWKWTYEQTADEETSFQENLWQFCRDGESLWCLNQGFSLPPYSSSAVWTLDCYRQNHKALSFSTPSWRAGKSKTSVLILSQCLLLWWSFKSVVEKCVCLGALILSSPHREWRLYLGCGMLGITGTLTTFALAHEVVVPCQERQTRRPQAASPLPP